MTHEHLILRCEGGMDVVAIIVDDNGKPRYESNWSQNEPGTLCIASLTREELLLSAHWQRELILEPREQARDKAIERMRNDRAVQVADSGMV